MNGPQSDRQAVEVLAPQTPRILAPMGLFWHRQCVVRFCTLVGLFFAMAIFGTFTPGIGPVILTVGPAAAIIYIMHQRYQLSTCKLQIAYTFLEAIGWMAVLLNVIGPVDALNNMLTSTPVQLNCKWSSGAGYTLITSLSLVASCQKSHSFHDTICSTDLDLVGRTLQDASLPGAILAAIEKASAGSTTGNSCELQEYAADIIGSASIKSFSYGGKSLTIDSNQQLAQACDDLFPGCLKPLDSIPFSVGGSFHFAKNTVLHAFIMAYFRAAFLEELLKYVAVRRILFKDRVVDCGGLLLYGLAGAAGFAAAENIQYALMHGIGVTYMRMILAIPLHCCTGMIIGLHLGYRKFLGRPFRLLLTLGVPVFVHGTYDFFLMVPHDFFIPMGLRILLVLATLIGGFVYCRYAWLGLENVCIVDVAVLQNQNLVSKSNCCCCECDCCSNWLVQSDPMLQSAPGQVTSTSQTATSSLTSMARRVSGELFPETPSCQTVPRRCSNEACAREIRVNIIWPCRCPFCHESQPRVSTSTQPTSP